jgi:hypothetical protein
MTAQHDKQQFGVVMGETITVSDKRKEKIRGVRCSIAYEIVSYCEYISIVSYVKLVFHSPPSSFPLST